MKTFIESRSKRSIMLTLEADYHPLNAKRCQRRLIYSHAQQACCARQDSSRALHNLIQTDGGSSATGYKLGSAPDHLIISLPNCNNLSLNTRGK